MDSVAELLGVEGPIARTLDGFSVRQQQQAMAQAIADAIDAQQDLIVEAGTGTGKTFAYLVPAICSGRKVIISTGTKNLQDQLFHRDIPLIRNALKLPVTCALLKGRSNYVCLDRLRKTQDLAPQQEPHLIPQLQHLQEFARQTDSGDIAQCDAIPEGDPLWFRVTSTADNCLGADCDDYQACFVMRARREAQAADLVVINHHLLLSDMALSEEGFGELLPAADIFVVDEAHQLPEVASSFFGTGVSTQQFVDLANDVHRAYLQDINETRDMELLCHQLNKSARDLRLVFGAELRRGPWQEIQNNSNVARSIDRLLELNDELKAQLSPLVERSKDLENAYERCSTLSARLHAVTHQEQADDILWYEVHRRSLSFHVTPLDIAPAFSEHKQRKGGNWIFTSATLTVDHRFDHFSRRLGLHATAARQFDSPFDFSRQALLYLPKGLPDPNSPDYSEAVMRIARQVLQASDGRAFLLFTSHRALRLAEQALRGTIDFPLLVQGEAPRDHLLESFRRTPNAVLLGTSSFWEGVDVRGEALSCVIIDKLPFATPSDPVLQARLDNLRRQGLNPFMQYQLPSAVITLKQGVGRLIRDSGDRGVLVLCDPRLRSKSYGRTFLQSLPRMPVTDSVEAVRHFFSPRAAVVGADA
ncbi:MAG: DEAD/DEAH box helicase [Gammaproteobacteria bacterium]|nr:DEAD/DEAH box helicase [Gammaproteobacteria bacterium]